MCAEKLMTQILEYSNVAGKLRCQWFFPSLPYRLGHFCGFNMAIGKMFNSTLLFVGLPCLLIDVDLHVAVTDNKNRSCSFHCGSLSTSCTVPGWAFKAPPWKVKAQCHIGLSHFSYRWSAFSFWLVCALVVWICVWQVVLFSVTVPYRQSYEIRGFCRFQCGWSYLMSSILHITPLLGRKFCVGTITRPLAIVVMPVVLVRVASRRCQHEGSWNVHRDRSEQKSDHLPAGPGS